MKNGKIFYIIVGVVVIVSLGAVFVSQKFSKPKSESGKGKISNTAPNFTPPVYGTDGTERFITIPLLLEETADQRTLSAEQEKRVIDFKKHVLARVSSPVPLKESEKNIITASVSIYPKTAEAGFFIADQHIIRFTNDELRLIKEELQK